MRSEAKSVSSLSFPAKKNRIDRKEDRCDFQGKETAALFLRCIPSEYRVDRSDGDMNAIRAHPFAASEREEFMVYLARFELAASAPRTQRSSQTEPQVDLHAPPNGSSEADDDACLLYIAQDAPSIDYGLPGWSRTNYRMSPRHACYRCTTGRLIGAAGWIRTSMPRRMRTLP